MAPSSRKRRRSAPSWLAAAAVVIAACAHLPSRARAWEREVGTLMVRCNEVRSEGPLVDAGTRTVPESFTCWEDNWLWAASCIGEACVPETTFPALWCASLASSEYVPRGANGQFPSRTGTTRWCPLQQTYNRSDPDPNRHLLWLYCDCDASSFVPPLAQLTPGELDGTVSEGNSAFEDGRNGGLLARWNSSLGPANAVELANGIALDVRAEEARCAVPFEFDGTRYDDVYAGCVPFRNLGFRRNRELRALLAAVEARFGAEISGWCPTDVAADGTFTRGGPCSSAWVDDAELVEPPTPKPSPSPSRAPTQSPTPPTALPTLAPSPAPTTLAPSQSPSQAPTKQPTQALYPALETRFILGFNRTLAEVRADYNASAPAPWEADDGARADAAGQGARRGWRRLQAPGNGTTAAPTAPVATVAPTPRPTVLRNPFGLSNLELETTRGLRCLMQVLLFNQTLQRLAFNTSDPIRVAEDLRIRNLEADKDGSQLVPRMYVDFDSCVAVDADKMRLPGTVGELNTVCDAMMWLVTDSFVTIWVVPPTPKPTVKPTLPPTSNGTAASAAPSPALTLAATLAPSPSGPAGNGTAAPVTPQPTASRAPTVSPTRLVRRYTTQEYMEQLLNNPGSPLFLFALPGLGGTYMLPQQWLGPLYEKSFNASEGQPQLQRSSTPIPDRESELDDDEEEAKCPTNIPAQLARTDAPTGAPSKAPTPAPDAGELSGAGVAGTVLGVLGALACCGFFGVRARSKKRAQQRAPMEKRASSAHSSHLHDPSKFPAVLLQAQGSSGHEAGSGRFPRRGSTGGSSNKTDRSDIDGLRIDEGALLLGPVIGVGGAGRIFKATYCGSEVAVKEMFPRDLNPAPAAALPPDGPSLSRASSAASSRAPTLRSARSTASASGSGRGRSASGAPAQQQQHLPPHQLQQEQSLHRQLLHHQITSGSFTSQQLASGDAGTAAAAKSSSNNNSSSSSSSSNNSSSSVAGKRIFPSRYSSSGTAQSARSDSSSTAAGSEGRAPRLRPGSAAGLGPGSSTPTSAASSALQRAAASEQLEGWAAADADGDTVGPLGQDDAAITAAHSLTTTGSSSARASPSPPTGSLLGAQQSPAAAFNREIYAEVRNLRRLRHPNVIQLYGCCETVSADTGGARLLVVMELAACSLQDLIMRTPKAQNLSFKKFTPQRKLMVTRQVCAGLAYVHDNHMIHFDVKSENILLDAAGNGKICDLGIAKFTLGPNDKIEAVSTGTPAYMAPELLRENHGITNKIDVYSFGLVLWQILYERQPHPRSWTIPKLFYEVRYNKYRPPLDPAVPVDPALRDLVQRCWAEDPDVRPPFHDIIAELDALMGARSVNTDALGAAKFNVGDSVGVWDYRERRYLPAVVLELDAPAQCADVQLKANGQVRRAVPQVELIAKDLGKNSSGADAAALADGSGNGGEALGNAYHSVSGFALLHAGTLQRGQLAAGAGDSDPPAPPLPPKPAALQAQQQQQQQRVSLRVDADKSDADEEQQRRRRYRDGARSSASTAISSALQTPASEARTFMFSRDNVLQLQGYTVTEAGTTAPAAGAPSLARTDASDADDSTPGADAGAGGGPDSAVRVKDALFRYCELGKGVSGSVHGALDLRSFRLCAVKEVRFTDRGARHQAVRELNALFREQLGGESGSAAVSCPYIVWLLEAYLDAESQSVCLVMELMDGGSLQDLLDRLRAEAQTSAAALAHQRRLLRLNKRPSSSVSSRSGTASSISQHQLLQQQQPESGVRGMASSARKAAARKLSRMRSRQSSSEAPAAAARSLAADMLAAADSAARPARHGPTPFQAGPWRADDNGKAEAAAPSHKRSPSSGGAGSVLPRRNSPRVPLPAQPHEEADEGAQDGAKDSGLPLPVSTGVVHERTLALIARSVLRALAFLHARSFVHLDLKPANVLINARGQVKLGDFGLARQLQQSGEQFASTFVGTMRYMSPERLRGQQYSYASDTWSLGVTLLTVAMGHFPMEILCPHSSGADSSNDNNDDDGQQGGAAYWQLLSRWDTGEPVRVPQRLWYHWPLQSHKRPERVALSAELRDFVEQTLRLDAAQRPSAAALLEHPWLRRHDEGLDMTQDDQLVLDSAETSRATLQDIAFGVTARLASRPELRALLRGSGGDVLAPEQAETLAKSLLLPAQVVQRSFKVAAHDRA